MKPEHSFSPLNEECLKSVLSFEPIEKLGQNFLVDPGVIKIWIIDTFPDSKKFHCISVS